MIRFGEFEIRAWRLSDADDLARYANNRKIWLQLRDGFPHPYTLTDAETFLCDMTKTSDPHVFAIACSDGPIGGIGLHPGSDVHRYSAEMGYWLAEPFWGQGIMTKAVTLLSEWGFEHKKLKRIFAEPYTNNPASARVLEKSGFKLEGIMLSSVVKNNKTLDQWLYAKTLNS